MGPKQPRGGIIVREGEAISSQKLPERLATGAIVEELALVGERLHYRTAPRVAPRARVGRACL
eukprot:6395112-Alexandrium_andersonii.AAC.1